MDNNTPTQEWLYGKTINEIEEIVLGYGQKKFTAKQICEWLYKKSANSIDEMTNLSLLFREELKKTYCVGAIEHQRVDTSTDGTKKYLFPAIKDGFIESAYIPDKDRATLCVSSQCGCRMGCKFCMTGRQTLKSNLSSGEILNQIKSLPERENLSNVVYMGMGEPLDNIENVLKSIEILTQKWGYGWSPTRITLSTIGIIPSLKRFINECNANLTISLHSADFAKREAIMPIQKSYHIEDIVSEIKKFDFTHQRRVSFGYIMFKGYNDSKKDADKICELLKGVYCRVNLIHFHQIPDFDLLPTPHSDILNFRDYLNSRGFITTIRASRGEDIFAACGMLSTKESEKND